MLLQSQFLSLSLSLSLSVCCFWKYCGSYHSYLDVVKSTFAHIQLSSCAKAAAGVQMTYQFTFSQFNSKSHKACIPLYPNSSHHLVHTHTHTLDSHSVRKHSIINVDIFIDTYTYIPVNVCVCTCNYMHFIMALCYWTRSFCVLLQTTTLQILPLCMQYLLLLMSFNNIIAQFGKICYSCMFVWF